MFSITLRFYFKYICVLCELKLPLPGAWKAVVSMCPIVYHVSSFMLFATYIISFIIINNICSALDYDFISNIYIYILRGQAATSRRLESSCLHITYRCIIIYTYINKYISYIIYY